MEGLGAPFLSAPRWRFPELPQNLGGERGENSPRRPAWRGAARRRRRSCEATATEKAGAARPVRGAGRTRGRSAPELLDGFDAIERPRPLPRGPGVAFRISELCQRPRPREPRGFREGLLKLRVSPGGPSAAGAVSCVYVRGAQSRFGYSMNIMARLSLDTIHVLLICLCLEIRGRVQPWRHGDLRHRQLVQPISVLRFWISEGLTQA